MKGFLLRLAALSAFVLAQTAWAQRVVILEFEGDRGHHLRTEVEKALKAAGTVDVVSLKKYREAAAKKGFRGSSAMTPAAVAKVGRMLRLDAAVEGALGDTFFVRILDASGQELWKKDLPLKRGMISEKHAIKLAKAIAVAAGGGGGAPKDDEERPPERTEEAPPPVARTEEDAPRRSPSSDVDLSRPSVSSSRESSRTESIEPVEPRREDFRDTDLEPQRRPTSKAQPKYLSVWVAGTTTWRSYCSRPGVNSCDEYAKLADPKPRGDTVDFSPQVPYAGFSAVLEGQPLAGLDSPIRGLGAEAHYARGFSLTNVKVQSSQGETPEKQVVSVDQSYGGALFYRFYFSGLERGTLSYVGLRGGAEGRMFEVDPSAQVPLPGSHRLFPIVGLDASVAVARFFRIEVGGQYFIDPKAGADEIAGYGNTSDPTGGATGSGFSANLGLAGDIWGPVGYSLKGRYTRFADLFYGEGNKWRCDAAQARCGGAAEEYYTSLYWGLTASF